MSERNALRLEGTQICLRPVCLEDVNQRYCDWLNNPEVNRYLETRIKIQTIDTISDYVKKVATDPDQFFLAICMLKDHLHIGNLKIGPVNWHHRHADISLFVGERPMWGHGYATEAIALSCDFAFNGLGLNKLKAGAYADNEASIKAFEKCGFQREGRLRGHVFENGTFTDVVLLGRLAADKVPTISRR